MNATVSGRNRLDVMETPVHEWIRNNPEDCRSGIFEKSLANKPTFNWIGDWDENIRQRVGEIVNHARANGTLFQIVLYNIPNRDCGGSSSGGLSSGLKYIQWVNEVACAIGSAEGIICVEPDAVAHCHGFKVLEKHERLNILREALILLRRKCICAWVYLDMGHPGWLDPYDASNLFIAAGGRYAHGISLNVSNSRITEDCLNYGAQIVEHFSLFYGIIIDTSRNGAGPPPQCYVGVDAWANVPSSRLGVSPAFFGRVRGDTKRLHGLLWVKVPGTSDGEYHGAPRSGVFWPDGAIKLVSWEAEHGEES